MGVKGLADSGCSESLAGVISSGFFTEDVSVVFSLDCFLDLNVVLFVGIGVKIFVLDSDFYSMP